MPSPRTGRHRSSGRGRSAGSNGRAGRRRWSKSMADAEVVPVAARAAAFRRATESERPQSTVRPLAAVDRSFDAPRIDDGTPVGADDDGPIVNVSIGRIEVRAPQPQPAAHATPTPMAPALTLDAYLRRRDGDDRR